MFGKDKQQKMLDEHHDPNNPSQNLTTWSEEFIDVCDYKDTHAGVLSPENTRKNQKKNG